MTGNRSPEASASTVRPALLVEDVVVRYGGHVAIDGASIRADAGRITGLLGPNGAGKTSLFNACTGAVRAAAGSVLLGEEPLTGLSSAQRAQLGLGRTFQRIELFDSLSVLENVRMGPEARLSGRRPLRVVWSSRPEQREIRERADEAVERCGLADLARVPVQDLPTGKRRLVELARAVATGFSFLLLDEPSSGLDSRETEAMCAVLQDMVDRDGIGILLVEHDMALVRAVCSYAYVLDFGRMICDGRTQDVLASDIVRSAYLGTEGAA